MADWKKEVEQAKQSLQNRSFVVELERDLPENSSLRIIEKLEHRDGKARYKVVSEEPKDYWY
jgi:hypothetical protein